MEISNDAYESLVRYFSLLGHTGYKPYSQVNKLLVFLFIEELLTGDMAFYMTESDYNDINNALYCLYGICMIPFPDYKRAVKDIVKKVPDRYRISETGILRISEDSNIRVMC